MTTLPEQIGPYRVLAKLGEGGMGLVYDAIDTRLGRRVALKTIRQDAAADSVARERFWREARLAASVNHPHICQIYEIGEAGPKLFLAMERLEGESLSVRLDRGALSLADTVRIGLEVLSALDALHHCRIVHRDLKPSNVFLTSHGVKLLDFGLARPFVDEAAETQLSLTDPGTIVGTPKYMAPEQLQGRSVDARTDLFVTGAILYEMLSGRSPFAAASLPAAVAMILHTDPPMLGGSPGIAAADRVIHRALAKAPEARYASAAAMADDLRTVLLASDREPRQARPVTRLIVLPFRLLRPDADTDFLTFSLADAITGALSSLESLVVRSPLAMAHVAAGVPGLKVIAEEADVDVALSGTVLRAGDELRVSAQLITVPSGTLMWSYSSQTSLGNIFRLQDELVQGIVESLALTLSRNEQLALGRDVPRSAKAYEFYLRANRLSRDPDSLDVARGLYLECLQADPDYAPAWAQIGRVYRILAKHRSDRDSMNRAESALDRALQLNPLLSIADRFYAEAEIDAGRALNAMVRLVRRASLRSNDPELYAALVSTCRYCGLMQASLAAHERARRLDPHVATSMMHTLIMMGDYQRAAVEADPHYPGVWIPAAMDARSNATQQCRVDAERARELNLVWLANLIDSWRDMLEGAGSHDAVCSATEVVFNLPPDLDGWFYAALGLSQFGGERGADRAVAILGDLIGRGFVPYDTIIRHPWLQSLRHRPDFIGSLQDAKRRHQEAQTAFTQAGGEALLGAGTKGSNVAEGPHVRSS
jgi:serine/threonine protein kinase/tetratricopeptide (TPR) repeat protein